MLANKRMMNVLFLVLIAMSTVSVCGEANGVEFSSQNVGRVSRGPASGIVLVSVIERQNEPSAFYCANGAIETRLGPAALSQLTRCGLEKLRIVSRKGDRCTYALMLNSVGRENEIIHCLNTMPGIIRAKRDYPLTLLVEPNDYYYQPDATDALGHWLPANANYYNGSRIPIRYCTPEIFSCCCEAPCANVKWSEWQDRDSIHIRDQWYLERARANRAWDIEQGRSDVKILVIDSGIDLQHPDLDGHMWDNSSVDGRWDTNHDGLPGGGFNNALLNRDVDGDGLSLFGSDVACDCGPDGDYGFGPNGIDDRDSLGNFGPGGGDDDPGPKWADNLCGPASQHPELPFNDDMDDVVFMKNDDDGNGYPDDTFGANLYDIVQDYGLEGVPDGLPGVKLWGDDDIDKDGGMHFNDPEVKLADFDGDGFLLCGADDTCDAGLDGDYGFGPNGIDDFPPGPGGFDDVASAWIDNTRGPGTGREFDDDMHDVLYLRYDNEEDGDPLGSPRDDSCPKAFGCHGTQMAGIIGAETNNGEGVAGYAWNCTLIPAKIAIGGPEEEYSRNPQAALERLIDALDYGLEKNVDIVNMSLGNYADENNNFLNDTTLQAKINECHNAGIVLVAGAGNRNELLYTYPASLDSVISISGANRFEDKAVDVNYNKRIDVCAPIGDGLSEPDGGRGSECYTTAYLRNPHTLFPTEACNYSCHGYAVSPLQTSGATAEVSGLATLLVSFYPKSRVQQMFPQSYTNDFYANFIEREIERGCVALTDTFYTGGWLGSGRIDAYRSLTQWGILTEDIVWNDRMYISGDFEIPWDKTLTILPGTTVYIMSDDELHLGDTSLVEFRVNGTLIAEGTAENPIEFRCFSDSCCAGEWGGIQVVGTGASASLAYCNISNAYIGVKSTRPIQISHCNIAHCEAHGIYLEGSGANGSQISNCTANENGTIGIYASGCANVTVSNCSANGNFIGVFLGNITGGGMDHTYAKYNSCDGILASGCQSGFGFNYCYSEDNDQQGMHLINSRGTISNSKLWKNSANGLYCYGSNCTPDVNHCKIEQNEVGVRVASGGNPRLGDMDLDTGQYNSIYNQPTYVYGSPSYQIKAENNWWGTVPGTSPDPTKFKGNVDYVPYMSSDPVQYLAPAKPNRAVSLSLAQNYPNPLPVSTPTMIRYSIPANGKRATLVVYDVSGRRVRTIVEGTTTSGDYSVVWDCRNDRGIRVVPGIYFCRLNVDGKTLTKKMVLVQR